MITEDRIGRNNKQQIEPRMRRAPIILRIYLLDNIYFFFAAFFTVFFEVFFTAFFTGFFTVFFTTFFWATGFFFGAGFTFFTTAFFFGAAAACICFIFDTPVLIIGSSQQIRSIVAQPHYSSTITASPHTSQLRTSPVFTFDISFSSSL